MSDGKRDGLIARIKKLFELAGDKGATEAEAVQAALMAQRLMAENDVAEWELADARAEREPVSVEASPARAKWRMRLAAVVAKNFRCKWYQSTRWKNGGRRDGRGARTGEKRMVFYGYEADARAAALTFDHLFRTGDRLANRAARRALRVRGWSDGVYNSFVDGFLSAVESELERQSQALMLVVPKTVQEGYEELSKGFSSTLDSRLRIDYYDREAREEGERQGRDALRARWMEEAPTPGTEEAAEALALPAAR